MSNGTVALPDVIQELVDRPFTFNFVQAAALLQNRLTESPSPSKYVGFDNSPDDEVVRFRVAPTFRNNSCQVVKVQPAEDADSRYELTVPFIGLIGVNGVLPRHYTQTVITRVKQHDYAMRDFYDLFHHRIISMFFRASVKYRLPYVYQFNAAVIPQRDDSITQALRCLVGIGESSLKNRLKIRDHTVLKFGGHFADGMPTAHSLERVITDFIGLPTTILQFQFEWLYIDPKEQTQLTGSSSNRLGVDVVVGERVPSLQNRFRIQIGPVRWGEFVELLPTSSTVASLSDLVRLYVGISLDFDLQVTLPASEIPECRLAGDQPPMLGWTTWLFSQPDDTVVDDAVFDIGTF